MDEDNVKLNETFQDKEEFERRIRSIVKAILSGESERFDEIYAFYHNRVYALAWSLTGNYDDAMDVVQESFLRTYRALGSWKGRSRFSTWIHRIVVNTSIDFIRREARHHVKRLSSGGNEQLEEKVHKLIQGVETRTPFSELERKELRCRIFLAINQLGGRQRKCFILRYFGHLSIRDVASVIGCGEGTVKRHLFRARQNLKQLLILE